MDSTYQLIKILENYFKIFTAFSDQANSSSGPSQILILQFPIPRAYLTIFCQTLPEPSETLLQHSLHHVLNRFPYFVPSNLTTHQHKYQLYQSICHVKQIYVQAILRSQYLLGKTRQPSKRQSLRSTSLSKLDNTVNSNSIFNTTYVEFSSKWQVLLHFHNPTCAYNPPYNLHQKFVPLLQ